MADILVNSMETVKDVLRAIFIIPFTAGQTQQNEEHHSGSDKQMDGSLSSTVLLTCFTSVVFVIVAVYSSKDNSVFNDHYIVIGIKCTLVLIGIVALCFVAAQAYQNRSSWLRIPSRENFDWKLKGKFLWMFGLVVIFDTSLTFFANLQCNVRGYSFPYHAVLSFQSISLIAFFVIQLAFLTYFRHYKMKSCIRINYGILIILFVNLCLWFCTVVNESVEDMQNFRNQTRSNNTITECAHNSTVFKLQKKMLWIFIPVRMKAVLLSLSFLLAMLPSIRNDTSDATTSFCRDTLCEGENEPLLGTRPAAVRFRERHPFLFFSFLTFGISMNIALIVSTLVFVFLFIDNEQSQLDMYPMWISIVVSYKSYMLVLVLLIIRDFARSAECSILDPSLSVPEYVLIFCNAASAASYTLLVLVVIQNFSLKSTAIRLYLTRNCLDIIIKFIQTIVIVSFKNLAPRRALKYIPLKYLYFLLAFGNFLMWCGNSFAGIRLRNLDADGFKNGGLFANNNIARIINRFVLTPIIIFYDFHASMDLFEMFRKVQNN